MNMDEKTLGDVAVLSLSGDMWIGGWDVHERVKHLVEMGTTKVVIDFAHMRLINSIGIGVLVASLKSLRDAGGDLYLSGANENIRNVLHIVNLFTLLKVFDTSAEAVAAFAA